MQQELRECLLLNSNGARVPVWWHSTSSVRHAAASSAWRVGGGTARACSLLCVMVAVSGAAGCTGASVEEGYSRSDGKCFSTRPNGDVPPGEPESQFSHGNGRIWTALPLDGVLDVIHSRGAVLKDGSLEFKFGWVRPTDGRFEISGSRLDRKSKRARPHILPGYEGTFQATSIAFPSRGMLESNWPSR